MAVIQIAAPDLALVSSAGSTLYLLEGLGFSADANTLLGRATYTDDADPSALHYAVWTYDVAAGQYTSCLNTLLAGAGESARNLDVKSAQIQGASDAAIIVAEVATKGSLARPVIACLEKGVLISDIVAKALGVELDLHIESFALSADGRFVALQTASPALAADANPDVNDVSDIYLLDRVTGQIERVSAFADGSGLSAPVRLGNVTLADGRLQVAFSTTGQLVRQDSNEALAAPGDAYLWSRALGSSGLTGTPLFTLISAKSTGQASGYVSDQLPLIATSSGVYFSSAAPDLNASDSNAAEDGFFLASSAMAASGLALQGITQLTQGSQILSASADGRFVTLLSNSPEIVGASGVTQLIFADRSSGAWQVISRSAKALADNETFAGVLSPDATAVAFTSLAENIAGSGSVALGGSLYIAATGHIDNQVPVSASATATLDEDSSRIFSSADFAFTDADTGDSLQSITITRLAGKGTLRLGGTDILVNQVISAADIAAGKLVFTPVSNANGSAYDSFDFRVSDGKSLSASSSTFTLNVNAVNDAPTGTALISGTAKQGETLTVSHTLADADGLGTVSYQWKADGVAISGATATTLVLGEALVGKAITVTASYTDGHGTAESLSSTATAAVANVNDAPTGAVLIAGTAKQGETLTASHTLEDMDGRGVVSYQWKADGVAITGATGARLILDQSVVGKKVAVVASYTDDHGTMESVSSLASSAVLNVDDAAAGQAVLTGNPKEGQVLNAVLEGGTDPDGAIVKSSYQWQQNKGTVLLPDWQPVVGQTGVSFSIPQGQSYADSYLRVQLTSTDALGGITLFTSTPVRVASFASTNILPTGNVSITGTAVEGGKLEVISTLQDADGLGIFNYQWFSDGVKMEGVTQVVYTPVSSDAGHQLTVMVSYSDGRGVVEQVYSAPTAKVSPLQRGVVQDGYLSGALVFVDANNNNQRDWIDGNSNGKWDVGEGESWALSDSSGQFSGLIGEGTLRITANPAGGTVDLSTGKPFVGAFSAPSGSSVINPITTLLTAALASGKTEAEVKAALGVDATVDLGSFDPIQAAGLAKAGSNEASQALKLQGIATQVASLISLATTVTTAAGANAASASLVADSVAGVLLGAAQQGSGKLDLTSAEVLGSAITAASEQVVSDSDKRLAIAAQATAIAESAAVVNQQISNISQQTGASNAADILKQVVAAQVVAQQTIATQAVEAVKTGNASALTINASNAATQISNASAQVVVSGIFVNHSYTGGISLEGSLKQGVELVALNTLSDVDGMSPFTYQWKLDGVVVPGASATSYVLTESEVGKLVSLIVSYQDGYGQKETVTTVATTVVANVNDLPTGSVIWSGKGLQGETLDAASSLADMDGLGSISYQWYADGVALAGATGSTLLLTESMLGQKLSVTGYYIDGHGTPESVSSQATGAIGVSREGTGKKEKLEGSAGDDVISGLAGNDTLIGLSGNDTLDGGKGNDTLSGGAGDDTYVVDAKSDKVDESSEGSGGLDTIQTALTAYVLGNNIENLFYTGKSAFTGTGNALVNRIVGGAGNDKLDGKAGADSLEGGLGNDSYFVDDMLDVVLEADAAGTDVVQINVVQAGGRYVLPSHIENATLVSKVNFDIEGNELANVLTGNTAANRLEGGTGDDILVGGAGNDTVNGGLGADRLTGGKDRVMDVFQFAFGDSGQLSGWDIITDFGKGKLGLGDVLDCAVALSLGGTADVATADRASVNIKSGIVTFAKGSGTTMSDALADLTASFSTAEDKAGEMALFRVKNAGAYYAFISDGEAGVTGGDLVIQLTGVSSLKAIDISDGNFHILS